MTTQTRRLPRNDAPEATQRPRQRLKRPSVSLEIRAALRARILSLDLAPGQNLSRLELADEYGVSQTPVRDAMMKLEEEGLLVIHPQSKTEVSKIDVAQARETQVLRLALEIEMAKRFAREAPPEAHARLATLLTRQASALRDQDLDRFADLDRQFHRTIFATLGMEELSDVIAARSGHIDRLRKLDLPEAGKAAQILDDHQAIVTAIKNARPDQIEAAVRAHLSGTMARLEGIVALYPAYF